MDNYRGLLPYNPPSCAYAYVIHFQHDLNLHTDIHIWVHYVIEIKKIKVAI